MTTYLVTADPPTPNGDLHVGHLSGPFLGADVFCRFQKMQGNRSIYLSSSDGHQSYVTTTARRLGRDPFELIETSTANIRSTLAAAEIHVDAFNNAVGNQGHVRFVQEFFKGLYDRGIVEPMERNALFCPRCERTLFCAFAGGRCPRCGQEASGNPCESCGRFYSQVELIEPRCTICGGEPIVRPYVGLFLPLERYRSQLREFYASRSTWRRHSLALCESLLEEPLIDFPVSHPADWGVPVPVPDFQDQVINVWIEMYPGYVQTTREWAEEQGEPELADAIWDGGGKLVQFLGYDNTFCNGVVHAALSLALGRPWIGPDHVITNEFYFLDGEKFSTSRDHVIWGRDVLGSTDASALRYHLARTNPEFWQTSFSAEDLAATIQRELLDGWNDSIARALSMVSNGDGAAGGPLDLQAVGLMRSIAARLERFYGLAEFSLRGAGATLGEYVEACGQYARRREDDSAGFCRDREAATLLRALAIFSAPLMPGFAQRLWDVIGEPGRVAEVSWQSFKAPPVNGTAGVGARADLFADPVSSSVLG